MSDVPTNPAAIYVWLFVAQWAFNLGVAAWLYFRQGDKDNADAVSKVAQALQDHITADSDINAAQNIKLRDLETTIRHLPTDGEMAAMRETVAATKAKVEGMATMLQRVEHQTNIIHTHLLRNIA